MGRLIGLLLALCIAAACDTQPSAYNVLRNTEHFNENKSAFIELSAAINADPMAQGISNCENVDRTYNSLRGSVEEQKARQKRFEPLLDALGFPDCVFFQKNDVGKSGYQTLAYQRGAIT